ncbi:MAG: outer membrane protein transport protein [Gemmatimonadaceae bacterium]
MQRHRLTRYLALVGSLAVTVPASARAQAFGINEIGTCAASRGFAVTGSPCKDASSIFWNPGAATSQKGWTFLAGAAVILINAEFEQDTTFREYESDVPTAVVPHAFINYRSENSKLAYGLGFYVPYGLTSQWTDSFPGRFQAQKAALATFYVQPNIAYQINDKWSLGGGPVFGHSTVELIQGIDLADQIAVPAAAPNPAILFRQLGIAARTEFAKANLNGSATAFGAHVGLFGQPTPEWSVGIRFLTPLEFEYDGAEATFTQTNTGLILPPQNPVCFPAGTNPICAGNPNATVSIDALVAASFTTGGPLVTQGVETKITHPAQIQGGAGYSGFKDWLVSVDYSWTGWRRFKELPVTFLGPANGSNRLLIEDYNNTSAIRIGAQRSFTGGSSVRFGFSGVASAAPDETVTPLLPEQDRSYLTLGGEYPITNGWAIEGAYLRVMAPGRRGRIIERSSRSVTATQMNSGKYELSANVISVSVKGNF